MPAIAHWPSEIWPAKPVTTTIDRIMMPAVNDT